MAENADFVTLTSYDLLCAILGPAHAGDAPSSTPPFTARKNNLDIQIRFGMGALHERTSTTKMPKPKDTPPQWR
jgi:hypothetical protein